MRVTIDLDNVDEIVAAEIQGYLTALEGHSPPYDSPIHSADLDEEMRKVKKDIKALKRVLGMFA